MCSQSFSVHTLLRMSGGPAAQPSPASAPGAGGGGSSRWALAWAISQLPGVRAAPAPFLVRAMLFPFSQQKKQLSTTTLIPIPVRRWPLVTPLPWMCGGGAAVRCGRRMQPDPRSGGMAGAAARCRCSGPRSSPAPEPAPGLLLRLAAVSGESCSTV